MVALGEGSCREGGGKRTVVGDYRFVREGGRGYRWREGGDERESGACCVAVRLLF